MDSTIVTLNEKVKRIEGTNDYMRIDTWISQARDDFARLHREIEPLIETTTKKLFRYIKMNVNVLKKNGTDYWMS